MSKQIIYASKSHIGRLIMRTLFSNTFQLLNDLSRQHQTSWTSATTRACGRQSWWASLRTDRGTQAWCLLELLQLIDKQCSQLIRSKRGTDYLLDRECQIALTPRRLKHWTACMVSTSTLERRNSYLKNTRIHKLINSVILRKLFRVWKTSLWDRK